MNNQSFLSRHGKKLVIAIPMIWLFVFFLLPFLVVLKISVAEPAIARPPYTPLFEWGEDGLNWFFSAGNYRYLWEDNLYLLAYLSSLRIALVSTIGALIIGYPMAYFIARSSPTTRNIFLMLVILPFWTSFLLRVYAWIGFLKTNGLINETLIALGLINSPIQMMQTDFAVYIGIIYTYLPFMILPLYANLVKLDSSFLEASSDLGASPLQTFIQVTLPLSMPGIIAGCMLVFIPAVGEFVIPKVLGGSDQLMIAEVLWDEYTKNRDWPVASAVAIAMLILVLLPILFLQRAQENRQRRLEET